MKLISKVYSVILKNSPTWFRRRHEILPHSEEVTDITTVVPTKLYPVSHTYRMQGFVSVGLYKSRIEYACKICTGR